MWAALFSFLYLDFLDTTGTFYSMATFINKKMPGEAAAAAGAGVRACGRACGRGEGGGRDGTRRRGWRRLRGVQQQRSVRDAGWEARPVARLGWGLACGRWGGG